MKRFGILFIALGLAAVINVAVLASKINSAPRKEQAVVEFATTVKLQGVLLRGEYLIVHDEERMAQGAACTYVYRGKQERAEKLIASFHCQHMDRAKSDQFKITFGPRAGMNDVPEIKEIQFAGSSDGHRVP